MVFAAHLDASLGVLTQVPLHANPKVFEGTADI
jgi:hypothetical protein